MEKLVAFKRNHKFYSVVIKARVNHTVTCFITVQVLDIEGSTILDDRITNITNELNKNEKEDLYAFCINYLRDRISKESAIDKLVEVTDKMIEKK